MYSRLNPGQTEEDIDHFNGMWQASKQVREHLAKLFKEDYEKLFKDDEDVENLSLEKLAFNLGQRKALRKIIDYLDQEV